MTPLYYLDEINNNHLYIKRDDLIPFSFGGNKARKAQLFFKEFDDGDFDCVVTYGSSSSNHCRVIANECSRRKIKCYIVRPAEASDETYNSVMISLFGAEIITVPANEGFSKTDELIATLIASGSKPFVIEGGGHGNTGTEAYVQCYNEILQQEEELNICFDYIFLASGTGTTQAGLVCGQILNNDKRNIIGISIARKNPRGKEVVHNSICSYLERQQNIEIIRQATHFIDDYANGYGKSNPEIKATIIHNIMYYGIPMDETYTGKAFYGMCEYLKTNNIKNKNILFIHTGGTPLFFDMLDSRKNNTKRG